MWVLCFRKIESSVLVCVRESESKNPDFDDLVKSESSSERERDNQEWKTSDTSIEVIVTLFNCL